MIKTLGKLVNVLLLCLLLVVLGFWVWQQWQSFWDTYTNLYNHEECARKEDTEFYRAICEDPALAQKTGRTSECHNIHDRHKRSIEDVAFRKAIDAYNICDVQCLKTLLFDATTITIILTVAGIFLCLRALTFLYPREPKFFPFMSTPPSSKSFFPDTTKNKNC